MSHKSVAKHVTILSGIWRWALEHRHLDGVNPWEQRGRLERHPISLDRNLLRQNSWRILRG